MTVDRSVGGRDSECGWRARSWLAVEQSDKQARVNTGQLGQHQQSRAGVAYPPIAVSVVGLEVSNLQCVLGVTKKRRSCSVYVRTATEVQSAS